MAIPDRLLLRLAMRIREKLLRLRTSRYDQVLKSVQDLLAGAGSIEADRARLALCRHRNWNAAAELITQRLLRDLRDLPFGVSEVERLVEVCKVEVPSVRDVFLDLRQAEEEFENLRYDKKDDLLVVTTEPIELEGVYLGAFEVQLQVGCLPETRRHGSVYRVVALDPHPAAANGAVTHPHVSDEHLCEGDASAAITAALANGRICDFFQLASAVLANYNPGSPYVALDDWEGRPCHECGCIMGEDDTRWCQYCDNDYCEQCASYCRRCDETACNNCLDRCGVCEEPVCPSCLTTCPDCGGSLCVTCLEEGQCPCQEESQEDQENEDAGEPTQTPHPAEDTAADTSGGAAGQQANRPSGRQAQTRVA